ncbi:MAG: ABC transporter permease [Gemmatimonadota bacterium]|jgi:predicted permease
MGGQSASLGRDLRFALRSWRKAPLLIAGAIITLGLGIGASATVFSGVDVFLLRPIPLPEAHRLVYVWTTNPEEGWRDSSNSLPDFLDWREGGSAVRLAAFRKGGLHLQFAGEPQYLESCEVSRDFFSVIGVHPIVGRPFHLEEEVPGGNSVAILSDGLQRRLFEGDTEVLGKTLTLDGRVFTVVGIMPHGFRFGPGSKNPEVWIPIQPTGEESRGDRVWTVIGRVEDGLSFEEADRRMASLAERVSRANLEEPGGTSAQLRRLRDQWVDQGFREGSRIASAAAAFLLLLCCVNVANLLLIRGAGRDREISLRIALGASRGRILQQLLAENLALALLGGLLGLALAWLGVRGLTALLPPSFPLVEEISVNRRVLLFTGIVSLLSSLLFGLGPAFGMAGKCTGPALHGGTRAGGSTRRSEKLRAALAAAEVSLACTLLVPATLLVGAYLEIGSFDVGYRTEDVLTFRLHLPESRYPELDKTVGFFREFLGRLGSLQAAAAAGGTSVLPTKGNPWIGFQIPGAEPGPPGTETIVSFRMVTPGYFETMEIPLIRGRFPNDADDKDAPRMVVLNKSMADRHWPGGDPIGKVIAFGSEAHEVVGIVGDTRIWGPAREPLPMVYSAAFQTGVRDLDFAVIPAGSSDRTLSEVRAVVGSIDSYLPIHDVSTMREMLEEAVSGNTVMARVVSCLGLLAFFLSFGGTFGVVSYAVAQRTREMGVRMAVGADRRALFTLVLGQGARLGAIGISAGLLLAAVASRGLSHFLFGISPFEPRVYFGVGLMALLAVVAATLFPAKRASGLDPARVLKHD